MTDRSLTHRQLRKEFWDEGLVYPELPETLRNSLETSRGFKLVATRDVRIDPLAGYGLEFGREGHHRGRDLPLYLHDDVPFFVSAARSNGYSAQWGFATRSGPLFVSVQTNIPLGRGDFTTKMSLNRATCAFNDLLASHMIADAAQPSLAVLTSSYRDYAFILSNDPGHCVAMGGEIKSLPGFDVPDDWGLVLAYVSGRVLHGTDFDLAARVGDNSVLRSAISFLRVVTADEGFPHTRFRFSYSFVDRESLNVQPLLIGFANQQSLILARPQLTDIAAEAASSISEVGRDPVGPFDLPDLLPGCMTIVRPNVDTMTMRASFAARRLGGLGNVRGLLDPE